MEQFRIHGTFDIAIARNNLRRQAAERGWKPFFRARVGAALTAMARLLLTVQNEGIIQMDIIERDNQPGMVLRCAFEWPDSRYSWLDEARIRMERVVDEIEVEDTDQGPAITVRVWVTQDTL